MPTHPHPAAAVYAARKLGMSADATLEWARREGLKFLGTQPLRNWVAAAATAPLAATIASAPAAPPAETPRAPLLFRQLIDPVTST
jgi:sulfur dioxygenase